MNAYTKATDDWGNDEAKVNSVAMANAAATDRPTERPTDRLTDNFTANSLGPNYLKGSHNYDKTEMVAVMQHCSQGYKPSVAIYIYKIKH